MEYPIDDGKVFGVKNSRKISFILYIFQLSFSSQEHRNKIYRIIADWETHKNSLKDINQLDWRL